MPRLLMPKATTVWLIENTFLSFQQIADFTGLHLLKVQAIADEEFNSNIHPIDPIQSGILTMEEIERCQKDPNLKLIFNKQNKYNIPTKNSAKYVPISKRSAKPNAIVWLINHYSNIKDNQIIKLIGTTKNTIDKLRNDNEYRSRKAPNPESPIELGLCTKNDLDEIIKELLSE